MAKVEVDLAAIPEGKNVCNTTLLDILEFHNIKTFGVYLVMKKDSC